MRQDSFQNTLRPKMKKKLDNFFSEKVTIKYVYKYLLT